jgi:serine/threonine protein phosphatase PrpC
MWMGFGQTHTGWVRENNEDSLLVNDALGLYLVADGMGGHAAGEVASRHAVETVERHLQSAEKMLAQVERGALFPDVLLALLEEASLRACGEIYHLGQAKPALRGMGTTLTAALCCGGWVATAHVGDSRLYLLREGGAEQVSLDHSLGAEMVRSGIFTPAEVALHNTAHVLTRALGTQPKAKIDLRLLRARRGDAILLCSDGLSGFLRDEAELASLLRVHEAEEERLDFLVQHALHAGGQDNISAVLVQHYDDALLRAARAEEATSPTAR